MTFFKYNECNENNWHLTYQCFFEFYVYNSTARQWHSCQWEEMIDYMYYCSLLINECYYFHLLLTVIQSLCFFENLCTIDEIVYSTFCEVYQMLSMLKSDSHWLKIFEQTTAFKIESVLWTFFIVIIKFDMIMNLFALWHVFCHNICDDLFHCLQICNDYSFNLIKFHVNYSLYLIQQQLQKENVKLTNVNFLKLLWTEWHVIENNLLLFIHLNYDMNVEYAQMKNITAQFNVDQW